MFNHQVFYALSLSQKQKLQFDVMPAALANMHSNVDRHMYPLILISTIALTDFAHEYSLRITFLSHILTSSNFLLCFPFPFECLSFIVTRWLRLCCKGSFIPWLEGC
jgi:hypothetical protein